MAERTARVSTAQASAAKLRLDRDKKLGRTTPDAVRKIPGAKPVRVVKQEVDPARGGKVPPTGVSAEDGRGRATR